MTLSPREPDHTLLDGESLMVKTPDGIVWISAMPARLGTNVAVYDDPDRNPVSIVSLRGPQVHP